MTLLLIISLLLPAAHAQPDPRMEEAERFAYDPMLDVLAEGVRWLGWVRESNVLEIVGAFLLGWAIEFRLRLSRLALWMERLPDRLGRRLRRFLVRRLGADVERGQPLWPQEHRPKLRKRLLWLRAQWQIMWLAMARAMDVSGCTPLIDLDTGSSTPALKRLSDEKNAAALEAEREKTARAVRRMRAAESRAHSLEMYSALLIERALNVSEAEQAVLFRGLQDAGQAPAPQATEAVVEAAMSREA